MEEWNGLTFETRPVPDAPALGKWLRLLFWISIAAVAAGILCGLMDADGAKDAVNVLMLLAQAAVLWKLSELFGGYRKAAVLTAAAACANLLAMLLSVPEDGSALLGRLLLSTAAVLVGLAVSAAADCQVCTAHGALLAGAEDRLSHRWRTLRSWYIGAYVMFACATVFMAVTAMNVRLYTGVLLGAVAILIAAVVLVVVDIMSLVALYRTARFFREV